MREEPRRILTLVRRGLLNIWRARGGGFYGLGYLVAFIAFEIQMLGGEVSESAGVGQFVVGQIAEYVFRFTIMSFVNGLLALIWPLYLLQWLDGWGFVALGVGYLLFETALRPFVETWFPELRAPDADADVE